MALIVNDHFLTRDDTPLLAKVTVPTLIINGKQDGVITPQSAEAVHAAIKGSQLVEMDDCGHFPFFEQPGETTKAVLGFTAATRGGKTSRHDEYQAGESAPRCSIHFYAAHLDKTALCVV